MNRGLDNKIKHLKISTKIFVILGCFTPFTFGLSSFVLFPGQHEIDTNVSGLVGQVIEPSAYFNITDTFYV